jgi:hypothetical protein
MVHRRKTTLHHYKAPSKIKHTSSSSNTIREHEREKKILRNHLPARKLQEGFRPLHTTARSNLRCIRSSTISTPSSCTRYKMLFRYFVPELELRSSNHDTCRVSIRCPLKFCPVLAQFPDGPGASFSKCNQQTSSVE